MSSVTAEIIVTAKDNASQTLRGVGDSATNLQKGFLGAVRAATGLNLASLSLVGGITGLGVAFKYAIDEASEHESVMAQTQARVKATGEAAGFSAKQLEDYATSLQNVSAFSDEMVLSAENMLLTFDNIKGENFKAATKAAMDLAAAMGRDLPSTAFMLGRALEDPTHGMMMMRRMGIILTDQQKDMVKQLQATGDAAKAQAYLLDILNSKFGGAATAQANTYAGAIAQVKNALSDLGEVIGGIFLPGMTKVAQETTKTLQIDTLLIQNLKEGTLSWSEYAAVMDMVHAGKLDDALQRLNRSLPETRAHTQALTGATQTLTEHMSDLSGATSEFNKQIEFAILSEGLNQEQTEKLGIALGVYDEKTIAAIHSTRDLRTAYDNTVAAGGNAAQAMGVLTEAAIRLQIKESGLLTILRQINDEFNNMPGQPAGKVGGETGDVPGKQHGGDVMAGQAYLVGEKGPEVVVPRMGGTVIPNGGIGGGMAIYGNVTVSLSPTGADNFLDALRQAGAGA